MNKTRHLSRWLAGINDYDIDKQTINTTKKCLLDFIGVSIAGSQETSSRIWHEYCGQAFSGKPQVTLLNSFFPAADINHAIAYNAATGHALDLDDLHTFSITHPGVITFPIALALGQKLNIDGMKFIRAVVAGYEAAIRIGEAINPSSYWYWHTTGVVGSFSAAAVAASIFGFDENEFNHAFGTAGSQAAGLWQFMDNGSMSKTLHVAKANLNGLLSAELTRHGLTGAEDILSGEKGFIRAVAPDFNIDKLTSNLGEPFKINEISLKPYPCCRHTHSAITAVLELKEKHGINNENVSKIIDRTYQNAIDVTDEPNPQTEYAHKFSLQYIIAKTLWDGVVDQASFGSETINEIRRQRIMEKITVEYDEEINAKYLEQPDHWGHKIIAVLTDGQEVSQVVYYPLGDVNNPLSWDDIIRKFNDITDGIISQDRQNKILEKILDLENLESINQIFT